MNVVNLHGRLTKEPLIRKTQSGKDVAQFYLAVDSHRKDAQGNTKADFIPCTMWNKLAELARLYLHKGSEIVVAGELHSGNYEGQDGRDITRWMYGRRVLIFAAAKVQVQGVRRENRAHSVPALMMIYRFEVNKHGNRT